MYLIHHNLAHMESYWVHSWNEQEWIQKRPSSPLWLLPWIGPVQYFSASPPLLTSNRSCPSHFRFEIASVSPYQNRQNFSVLWWQGTEMNLTAAWTSGRNDPIGNRNAIIVLYEVMVVVFTNWCDIWAGGGTGTTLMLTQGKWYQAGSSKPTFPIDINPKHTNWFLGMENLSLGELYLETRTKNVGHSLL